MLEGNRQAANLFEKRGLVKTVDAAQQDSQAIELSTVFTLEHRDLPIGHDDEDDDEASMEVQEHSVKDVAELEKNAAVYMPVEKVAPGKKREYTVKTSSGQCIGTFTEQRGTKKAIEEGHQNSSPTLKLTATDAPVGDVDKDPNVLNHKIIYAFAMATKLLADFDTPPHAKDQITLKGGDPETLKFIFTALLLIGKEVKGMKFSPAAIRVTTIDFDPSKEITGTGYFWGFTNNSCYNTYFKNSPFVETIIKDINRLSKDKTGNSEKQSEFAEKLTNIAQTYKERLHDIDGRHLDPDNSGKQVL